MSYIPFTSANISAILARQESPQTYVLALTFTHHTPGMPYFSRQKALNQKHVKPAIKYIAREPSLNSRLTDIGYVDRMGTWHKIVNILDQKSCHLG